MHRRLKDYSSLVPRTGVQHPLNEPSSSFLGQCSRILARGRPTTNARTADLKSQMSLRPAADSTVLGSPKPEGRNSYVSSPDGRLALEAFARATTAARISLGIAPTARSPRNCAHRSFTQSRHHCSPSPPSFFGGDATGQGMGATLL